MKDYPGVIEIQFSNQCNANCAICPYSNMNYSKESMNDVTFQNFLEGLKPEKLNRLIPYLNNEPFLDPHFIDKIIMLRDKCPSVEIEISTNASLLTEEKLIALESLNITELRLSVFGYYDETYKRNMPSLNREKIFVNLNLVSKVLTKSSTIISIVMIDDGIISEEEFEKMKSLCDELGFKFERWGFLDRAKNVKNKSNNYYNEKVCGCEQNRPTERMHILSNGNVILCCQDWSHSTIIGNINNATIEEIWNGENYNQIRKNLFDRSLCSPEICKNCKLATL